ncbi:MAG: patatin-like phospholipase family protein [Burkholderiales bacterium]
MSPITPYSSPMAAPATVSLVLGGGGARGLAHIGVIRWLTDNGYEIRSIAGSSMGALVGGIFAAAKLDVYTDWVSALERFQVVRLLDPAFDRSGLFKGERIISVLRTLIGDLRIEELPIKFTAVATDLETGEEVWLREGKLWDAIRASIATPMVFTPFKLGERLLLDGALVNPVPIAPTLGDDTDLTVAVNLAGPAEERPAPLIPVAHESGNGLRQNIRAFIEKLQPTRPPETPTPRMFDIAFASMQVMQDKIARLQFKEYSPGVTVEIPRNTCGFHEFWRAAELIELGYERAARAFGRPIESQPESQPETQREAERIGKAAPALPDQKPARP